MQQRSKYLVPSFPAQSRVDELNRVHADAKKLDLQRTLTLESLELNEQRRQSRLRQAKALLQTKSLSKEVSQKLQASCSLPELNDPCGEQTSVLQLLNRRVDVNRLRLLVLGLKALSVCVMSSASFVRHASKKWKRKKGNWHDNGRLQIHSMQRLSSCSTPTKIGLACPSLERPLKQCV